MTEHRNSAQRLLVLINAALQQAENKTTVEIWAEVLGLDSQRTITDPHNVQEKLGLVRKEIDQTRALMEGTPYSKHLYAPYLDRIQNVVSVPNPAAPWAQYRGNLQADTILALGWCSETLAPEPHISMEELQEVLDTVLKLRMELNGLTLSPGIREFLLRQLEIIETGIRDYPIRGSAALNKAVHDGFTNIVSASVTPSTTSDNEGYSKVGKAWQKFREGAAEFVNMDKFATAFIARWEQLQIGAVQLLDKLTS